MNDPRTERIPRRGRGTAPDRDDTPDGTSPGPASWADIERSLRTGEATCWLSVRSPNGVHTRPVFAAWTGDSFVIASKSSAAKTAHLDADGRVSLAVQLPDLHVVVEGLADRLTETADLTRASTAMFQVYHWPTTVVGDELDAPYAAPTSGGPPFRVYRLTPTRAYAFPMADQVEPTRFRW